MAMSATKEAPGATIVEMIDPTSLRVVGEVDEK